MTDLLPCPFCGGDTRLRAALQEIVDVWVVRSELFTDDETLAANLHDRAVLALKAVPEPDA